MGLHIDVFPTNPDRKYYNEHPEQYSSEATHVTMKIHNTTPFEPTDDYNPTSKKYVDEHGVQISENPQGGYDLVGNDGIPKTVAKQNDISALLTHFTEFVTRPFYRSTDRMALNLDGISVNNGNCILKIVSVQAGERIHINSTLNRTSVRNFQFQSSATVPTSGTNPYIVGTPSDTPYTGMVTVPNGATYLVMTVAMYGGESDGVGGNQYLPYPTQRRLDSLPVADSSQVGNFVIRNVNNVNDELYCCMKKGGEFTWVKIYPTT